MIKRFSAVLVLGALFAGSLAVAPSHAAKHTNAAMPMSVMLGAQAFSGVTGTATLSYAAGMTTVKVTVKHVEAGSMHPAHIHAGGSCTANGAVIGALTTLKANNAGIATSTTMLKGDFTTKSAYINVHLGPGLALTQFTVLACGVVHM